MIDKGVILEVIVCTVADAIEAESGGAKRLEVIRDFARGGMTPGLEFVREVLKAVSLPVRVMLRESDGYGVRSEGEVDRLYVYARELSALKVDGVVLGFIREGRVDAELTQRVLSYAPALKATFHHAFEETSNPYKAIETLKTIPQVDRILTAGGRGDWSEKIERLDSYKKFASPEIAILAGGGLNQTRIKAIRTKTAITEYHVGRAVRYQSQIDGPVQAQLVRELVRAID